MKKISLAIYMLLIVASCTKEHSKEYITLSGKLINNTDSIATISNRAGVLKTITINPDGSFVDTLKVPKQDIYIFKTTEQKIAPVYLKNGFDISIEGDAEKFMTSFKYSGYGASNTNYIIAQSEESKNLGNLSSIFSLEEPAFKDKVSALRNTYDSILNSYKDLDTVLVKLAEDQNKQIFNYIESNYAVNKKTSKGSASPKFENYKDIKGGTKSLDSFKGKFVYIDVWATWCGPCIREIPYLKKLEKEYHSKNIVFISISTDEARRNGGSWEAAEKKWRGFVKEKQMTGVQLWAGEDFSFQQAYQINAIPRFILIDPQGNIVEANAPRPSDPQLKTLFTSLGL